MAFTRGTPAETTDFSGGASTTIATPAFNLGAGKLVLVGLKWEASTGTVSLADTAGNVYVALTQKSDASVQAVQVFYRLSSLANASNVITATLPAGSTFRNIVAIPYTPNGVASFIAEANGAGNSTLPLTGSLTAADLGFAVVSNFGGLASSPNAGWTEQADQGPNNGSSADDRIDSPGGTITAGCTIASANAWVIAAASFKDTPLGPTYLPAPGVAAKRRRRRRSYPLATRLDIRGWWG